MESGDGRGAGKWKAGAGHRTPGGQSRAAGGCAMLAGMSAKELRKRAGRRWAWAAVLAGVLAGSGCSSFRSDARAARQAGTPPAGSVAGRWEGRWEDSQRAGHGGPLTCVLTPVGDHVYRLSTRAGWWRVFRSSYDTHVVLTPVEPGVQLLQGTSHLGLFGLYSVTGRVDAVSLRATYRVGKHSGVMTLSRPKNF